MNNTKKIPSQTAFSDTSVSRSMKNLDLKPLFTLNVKNNFKNEKISYLLHHIVYNEQNLPLKANVFGYPILPIAVTFFHVSTRLQHIRSTN